MSFIISNKMYVCISLYKILIVIISLSNLHMILFYYDTIFDFPPKLNNCQLIYFKTANYNYYYNMCIHLFII